MLEEISLKVNKIAEQMDGLESRNGPLATHDLRLESVEGLSHRAHERIDEHNKEIEELQKANTTMQIRLGAVLVPIASAIGAVVAKLL